MAARQHYSVSNAAPVNNTSNATWADVVVLPVFEPDASSTYAFFWSSALQNATNATADAQLRVRFGPAGFETTVATLNLESAATTEYPQLAGMFFHVEGSTPIDVYADVAIKAETNTNSINAKNGQIDALKLGANDVAAESLTRQTTTSTTPADAVTANFTSDGGDYVVVGYGEFDCNTASVPVYIRLRCEGTNTGEIGARTNDATNLTPGMMVWRFASVPSGARSAGFQYRSHSSGTISGITNARILVMRAADFDAVYGAQLTSDSTGTQSDAVAITFTETLTANPHLLLGGWGTSGTTTSTNITTQLTEAGSDIAESIRRTYNAAAVRFHNSAFASVRTPGSGSKTYTLDRVQSGSANIAVGAGSALALIDLGSSGGPTTSVITAASISATAQSLTTNAKKQSAVTAASITATGQTLTTKIAKTSLIVAASIAATGRSITTNAKRVSLIVAASIAATAQSLTTNAKRVSSITLSQITATGQALSTKVSKRSAVVAATITATAQSLTTRVTSETISNVVAASITVTAQALSTGVTTVSSAASAMISATGRTVVTKGSAVMAGAVNIMDMLHDLTNRLLDVVLLGSSNNDTPTGYYEELARACEALAGTSPSPLANPVDDGYLLRAATALETIASTDGSAENANYNGLLKRTVDALEDYTGTSSEGSLLHRLRTAVYQL